MGPAARKLELFGRVHNLRAGWLSMFPLSPSERYQLTHQIAIGNQLPGVNLVEPILKRRYQRYLWLQANRPSRSDSEADSTPATPVPPTSPRRKSVEFLLSASSPLSSPSAQQQNRKLSFRDPPQQAEHEASLLPDAQDAQHLLPPSPGRRLVTHGHGRRIVTDQSPRGGAVLEARASVPGTYGSGRPLFPRTHRGGHR